MIEAPRGRPIIFLIARREIQKRVGGPVFRIGTVVMVVLIGIGIAVASIAAGQNSGQSSTRVGFTSATRLLEPAFAAWASSTGTEVTVTDVPDAATGAAQVTAGTLDVLVTGSPTAPVVVVQDTLQSDVQSALEVATLEARLVAAGLTPAQVTTAMAGSQVEVHNLSPSAPVDPDQGSKIAAAIFVAFLLYLSLALYGTFVAQGVVEEKATRIVEILLGTVRPIQLLAGKIIGIGLAGLLQLSIIGIATLMMVHVSNVISIPALNLDAILAYLIWFVLGFLFYATAYAAVASLVSRQEDVSGAIAPIMIFLVASYVLAALLAADPGSSWATVVSILPPFAPIVMSVRMATGDATAFQVALAIVLDVVSIAGLIWLASRIYASSILQLGGHMRFLDALRATRRN